MNGTTQQEEHLIRNLHDAGCSHEFVEHFMDKHITNNLSEKIRLLTEHRSTVLHSIHEEQFKLDCVDYLLFQMKHHSSVTR